MDSYNYPQIESTLGTYFVWDEQEDKKLRQKYGESFTWDNIFPDTTLQIVRWVTLDEFSTDKKDLGGYVYPTFPFLEWVPKNYTEKAYNILALQYFNLEDGHIIPSNKVAELTAYRNALLEQLKRHAELCRELNNEAIRILKVYWYETDRKILNEDNPGKDEARSTLILFIRRLFDDIRKGIIAQDLLEERELLSEYAQNTPQEIKKATVNGLRATLNKKEPIVTHGVALEERLFVVEDLIRWALISQKVLDPETYGKITEKRSAERIAPEVFAVEMKNRARNKNTGYTVEDYKFVLKYADKHRDESNVAQLVRDIRSHPEAPDSLKKLKGTDTTGPERKWIRDWNDAVGFVRNDNTDS